MKPNIVYIFCDELRADALGCYNPDLPMHHTPNIDALAEEGLRYDRCYCNSPVCVPSRMSLLTGLYPEQTGVYHNEASLPPFSSFGSYQTIPSVLREHGYATASFGKTHLPWEVDSGFEFEDSEGGEMTLGLNGFSEVTDIVKADGILKNILAGFYPAGKDYQPQDVTKNSIRWMKQQADPFFVRISYLQPHTPVIAPHSYASVDELPFSSSLGDISGLSYFEQRFARLVKMDQLSENELLKVRRCYHYLVAWLDEQVGQITKAIQELNNGRDTIIILGSDHGANLGEHGSFGKMTFSPYSQRVPLIIVNTSSQKGVVSEICSNIDLGRTIFGLAGITAPEQFGGVDLLQDGPSGTAYSSIGYGDSCSYPAGYDALGDYKEGYAWPRRACLRRDHYRLDMNVRINGLPVRMDMEDLFFVDTSVCPLENQNMAQDSAYSSIIEQMRGEILAMQKDSLEVPHKTLEQISECLKDRSFFRHLIAATKKNDTKKPVY